MDAEEEQPIRDRTENPHDQVGYLSHSSAAKAFCWCKPRHSYCATSGNCNNREREGYCKPCKAAMAFALSGFAEVFELFKLPNW